jgi:hypothetical protein
MKSKALDKVLKYFREEAPVMSFSAGGGALYRGSAKNDSGSPTAGVDLRLKQPYKDRKELIKRWRGNKRKSS